MRNLLLTYAQKTPVSALRLIQNPGRGFVLEIRMVSHHHRLSVWQLVARKRRLVVLGRHVVGARARVVARLHHLHVLLVRRMRRLVVVMLLLRMWLLRMLRVRNVHRGGDGDVLRPDRRAFVHGYLAGDLAHRNALRRVEIVVGRCGIRIIRLLREEILFVRIRY
jgi:hypothetical protein